MRDVPQKRRSKNWDLESMQKAYNAIINKEMGYIKASKVFVRLDQPWNVM